MNFPTVAVWDIISPKYLGPRKYIGVVNSAFPDGRKGCYWHLYDENGRIVSSGMSKGWDGNGTGSNPAALKLARRAAVRHSRR